MNMNKVAVTKTINDEFVWVTRKRAMVDDNCPKCKRKWEYHIHSTEFDLVTVACVRCHVGQMSPCEIKEITAHATASIKL
jgi:Zn ribbon nucleic-acid-binding protein